MMHTPESEKNPGSIPGIPCIGCGECRGCPMELDIPTVFTVLNAYFASGDVEKLQPIHSMPGDRQPKGCVGCGECLGHCPEHIDIAGWMLKGAALLKSLEK